MELFEVYNNYDINLVSAKGIYLQDDKGNQYKDFYGGHGVISIGHSHPNYIFRMENQLNCLGFYSNAVKNTLQEKLAQKLGEVSGYIEHKLFLCNSGAEANENALKLASFHTGRKKIVAVKGAFHGRTSACLAITDNHYLSSPFNCGHDIEFVEMNDIDKLQQLIEKNDVAAFIIEGIQGVNGVVEPENKFLSKAAQLCKTHGSLLILDEIQSGYGRTGKFFAHQHAGIKADIITCAKGMGNGFPVAGVLISADIKAQTGMLGSTFGGNHLACAAAMAVLESISEEKMMMNADLVGKYIIDELSKCKSIAQARGRGLMIAFDIENMSELRNKLLNEYAFFTGASGEKTIRLLPPLNIKMDEAKEFIVALKSIIEKN